MRYFVIITAIAMAFATIAALYAYPRCRFQYIVVHHSAGDQDNLESIRNFHVNKRKWRFPAYHLILSNGRAGVPMGYLEPTARYKYLLYSMATKHIPSNLNGLHICIVGNYENHEVPGKLRPAIGNALVLAKERFGLSDDCLVFHRDVGCTVCPGKFITKKKLKNWMAESVAKCPQKIREQQASILDMPFSFAHIPATAWVFVGMANLTVLGICFVVWLAIRIKNSGTEKT